MRDRIKAAFAFVLAWLSTPTSKVGIVAVLTAALGKYLSPAQIDALYWIVLLGAGVGLILWPQKTQQ